MVLSGEKAKGSNSLAVKLTGETVSGLGVLVGVGVSVL